MRKNQIFKNDNRKKLKSRAKYDCPAPLDMVMVTANQISDEGGLPDIDFFVECFKKKVSPGIFENFDKLQRNREIAQEIVYGLMEQPSSFILNLAKEAQEKAEEKIKFVNGIVVFPPAVCEFIVNNYVAIKNDIDNFIEFVKMLHEVRTGIRDKHNQKSFSVRAIVFIGENNRVNVESRSPIFDAIEGIDADRLRICQICGHIFWASRKNSQGCSKLCVNALYQRNLRARNKENINRQRRKNYYYNKSIPHCEKCMSPVTKCSCYINERSESNGTL